MPDIVKGGRSILSKHLFPGLKEDEAVDERRADCRPKPDLSIETATPVHPAVLIPRYLRSIISHDPDLRRSSICKLVEFPTRNCDHPKQDVVGSNPITRSLRRHGVSCLPGLLPAQMERYQLHAQAKGFSPATISHARRCVGFFADFLGPPS